MFWFYVAALILGSVLVVPMVLGGLDSDSDFDFDSDLDADADLGDGSVLGPAGDLVSSLLSVRSLAFFAAFFGLTGTALEMLDYSPGVALTTALVLGAIAAALNTVAFTALKRSQNTSHTTRADLEGRPAVVVVPIEPGRRGRIRFELSGQPQYMVANAIESSPLLEPGHPVVVVEIERGVATVASMKDMGLPDDEPPPLNP